VLIFKDGKQPLDPRLFTSQFNHVFAVVQVEKKFPHVEYKIGFAYKYGVEPFEPFLHKDAIFEKGERFRNFLLTKRGCLPGLFCAC
jgi:hypothetical protein